MLRRCAVSDEPFNDVASASSTKTSARVQFAVNSHCSLSFSFDFSFNCHAFSSLGDSFLVASVSRLVGASTSMVKPDNNCTLPQQWTPQVAVVVWMLEIQIPDFKARAQSQCSILIGAKAPKKAAQKAAQMICARRRTNLELCICVRKSFLQPFSVFVSFFDVTNVLFREQNKKCTGCTPCRHPASQSVLLVQFPNHAHLVGSICNLLSASQCDS
jgi:hypothetical protein